jgi:hypothetical protein
MNGAVPPLLCAFLARTGKTMRFLCLQQGLQRKQERLFCVEYTSSLLPVLFSLVAVGRGYAGVSTL